jgi:hypothetical protein
MFKFLFSKKQTLSFQCSTRDLLTIKRYIADGFKVVFKGAVAVLTKIVRV